MGIRHKACGSAGQIRLGRTRDVYLVGEEAAEHIGNAGERGVMTWSKCYAVRFVRSAVGLIGIYGHDECSVLLQIASKGCSLKAYDNGD